VLVGGSVRVAGEKDRRSERRQFSVARELRSPTLRVREQQGEAAGPQALVDNRPECVDDSHRHVHRLFTPLWRRSLPLYLTRA